MSEQIKAYGINHAMQLIIGFRSYNAASLAVDRGLLDWAGDRDAYHKLDKEELKGYLTIYHLENWGGKNPNG
jgi:hypothetical protein